MKAVRKFEDELLRIKTTSENLCSCTEIKYNALSGVYEAGEAFYWIFGENQIYIITKRNNDMDVINRLREFLTMKAGKKFSICS